MVIKTVDTKMLQMFKSNNTSFGKVVENDQLCHLVINKIIVAIVTTFKNPKWRTSAQVLDFIYFFKKISK